MDLVESSPEDTSVDEDGEPVNYKGGKLFRCCVEHDVEDEAFPPNKRRRALRRRTRGSSDRRRIYSPLDVMGETHEQVIVAVLGDVALLNDRGHELSVAPQRLHILAVLAAAAGAVVSRSALAHEIWGTDTPAAQQRLKTQLSQLRSMLADGVSLESHRDGYRLRCDQGQLDSTLFETLLTKAYTADDDAYASCVRAVGLWRDTSAFVGIDSVLVDDAKRHLELQRTTAVLRLGDHEIARRSPLHAPAQLWPLFESDMSRGDVVSRLATLLTLSGRQPDALRLIGRHRDALMDIGLLPDAEVTDLEGRILRYEIAATPADSTPLPTPRSFGLRGLTETVRRAELEDRVLAALDHRSVVLVGEPGVGKSVLVEMLADALMTSGRGSIVVSARPNPARPLEVVAQIIEQMAALEPALVEQASDHPDARPAIARLGGANGGDNTAITRERLLAVLARLLRETLLGSQRLLVIEDVQWLDHSSAEIIAALLDDGPRMLATSRTSSQQVFDVDPTQVIDINMPGFTVAEIQTLLDFTPPARPVPGLAETLHVRTGGNGMFVRIELDLLADGQLTKDPSPTIKHAVHERTAGLSRGSRDVLRTAALLGRSFSLAPLLRVHPNAASALVDPVAEHLVRIDEAEGVGEFVHGLVADSLTESLLVEEREMRHDRLCEALIAEHASPMAIAAQAFGATRLDPVRSVERCSLAAQEAAGLFDWNAAIEWARRGIEALEQGLLDFPRLEVDLLTLVGTGLRRLNRAGSEVELSRAAELAHTSNEHSRLVRAVIELCLHGPTTHAGLVDSVALLHLERALEAPIAEEERAQLLASAATLLTVSDEATLGRTYYREALRLAQRSTDPLLHRAVWMNAHLGLAHPDDAEDRRLAAKALATYDDHEASWEASFLNVGFALIDADRALLDESLTAVRRLTVSTRQRNHQRALMQVETVGAFIEGDLDRASQLADDTFAQCLNSFSATWATSIYAALLFPIRDAQGRVAELAPAVAGMLKSSPDFVTWHVVAAGVHYASGDDLGIRRELEFLHRVDFRLVEDTTFTAIGVILCRPIWAVRDEKAARIIYNRLLPYADQMTWNGLSTHGPVDTGLALLADVLGDVEAAERHRSIAKAMVERFATPHLLWPELQHLGR
jgi:DNA-binding SARP family transcriptional activator/energy-coupling factor transporter ATP-binding protein EcfA2